MRRSKDREGAATFLKCQSRGAERRNGSFITLTHRQPGEEEEVVEVLPWWCRACWDVGAGAGQK